MNKVGKKKLQGLPSPELINLPFNIFFPNFTVCVLSGEAKQVMTRNGVFKTAVPCLWNFFPLDICLMSTLLSLGAKTKHIF